MKKFLAGAVIVLGLLGLTTPAQAAVLPSYTVIANSAGVSGVWVIPLGKTVTAANAKYIAEGAGLSKVHYIYVKPYTCVSINPFDGSPQKGSCATGTSGAKLITVNKGGAEATRTQ